MTRAELISYVESKCFRKATRVYTDPTNMAGIKLTRIKLLGARIGNEALKDLQWYITHNTYELSDGGIVVKIDRNIYTTGGKYTSPLDVCIYLQ